MESNCEEPLNIGSEEMVTINELAEMAIKISGKKLTVKNIDGKEFLEKYGFNCPVGVRGRNSDNSLFQQKIGWSVGDSLESGMRRTFPWINTQVKTKRK